MENISEQQDGYAVAKERVHQLKKFYVSLSFIQFGVCHLWIYKIQQDR